MRKTAEKSCCGWVVVEGEGVEYKDHNSSITAELEPSLSITKVLYADHHLMLAGRLLDPCYSKAWLCFPIVEIRVERWPVFFSLQLS